MLKVAVVGIGAWGSRHAEKYAALPGVQLHLVDSNLAEATRLATRLGCCVVRDFRKLPLLGVQAASVVTPSQSHYEVASWLLQHGVDLLVEKPICSTGHEGQHLVELADIHRRVLQVGHIERFNPAYQFLRKRVVAPQYIEICREATFSGRCTDVDVVLDLMIHDLDIVLDLVGRRVLTVQAMGQAVVTSRPDLVEAQILFEGGIVARLRASRVAKSARRMLQLVSGDDELQVDLISRTVQGKAGTLFSSPAADPLSGQLQSFLNCVKDRTPPIVSGECGVRAVAVAAQVQRAILEGKASTV